jgi:hypothetical protein
MSSPTLPSKHSELSQKYPDLSLRPDSSLDNQSLGVPMSISLSLDEVVSLPPIPSIRELRKFSHPFPFPFSIIIPKSRILLLIRTDKSSIPLLTLKLLDTSNMVRWDNDLAPIDIGTGVTAGITIPDILSSMDRVRKRDHGWVEAGSQVRIKDIIVFMYIEVEVIEERHEDASVNPRFDYLHLRPLPGDCNSRTPSFVNHTSPPPPPPQIQQTNKDV